MHRFSDRSTGVSSARGLLAVVSSGYYSLVNAAGTHAGVRDVARQRDQLSRAQIVAALAAVRAQSVLEMSIAHSLGDDVSGSRLDSVVDSQIAQLFGRDIAADVYAHCAIAGCVWRPGIPPGEPVERAAISAARAPGFFARLVLRFLRAWRGK